MTPAPRASVRSQLAGHALRLVTTAAPCMDDEARVTLQQRLGRLVGLLLAHGTRTKAGHWRAARADDPMVMEICRDLAAAAAAAAAALARAGRDVEPADRCREELRAELIAMHAKMT